MTTVAALGFDDIPPEAFSEAYGTAAEGAWIAFNIKADFLEEDEESGFRGLIRRMVREGSLEVLATRRYVHRLSIAGEPLEYVAVVGRKRSRWRRFGTDRPLHGTAHDALMAAPLIGDYFRRMGVLPAAPDSIASALAEGHDVALWPGGEIDSLRPWTDRDEAVLAGRKGFIRMAINAGVPIVPIATVGGPDSMPVLFRGRRLAKALQLDKVARLKMFPFALSAPWGLAPAMLPELPLPTKIRTAFQPAVTLSKDPAKAKDDRYVDRKYEEVRQSIQGGMDALARRRPFPVFG